MSAPVIRLPRTIRLDPSDTFVFERAAEPGEWAVSGSFLFMGADSAAMSIKQRHAFRSGFLGTASLGFATLATVSEARNDEYEAAIEALAQAFLSRLGAPDIEAAREAAQNEFSYARGLCDHPVNTLIAVQRHFDEEGNLREQFRTLRPREGDDQQDALHKFARAFTFHEIDDETSPSVSVEERVDLLALSAAPATGALEKHSKSK